MRPHLHASESCLDCISYAACGVVAISPEGNSEGTGSLPLPKQNCQCQQPRTKVTGLQAQA